MRKQTIMANKTGGLRGLKTRALAERSQKGFTLLEVLVSLALAGFGMVAVVSFVTTSLQTQSDTEYKKTAVSLTNMIADKMRANAAAGYAYDMSDANSAAVAKGGMGQLGKELGGGVIATSSAALSEAAKLTSKSKMYTAACDDPAKGCEADSIAANDIYLWENTLQAELPMGVGFIVRNASDAQRKWMVDPNANTNYQKGTMVTQSYKILVAWGDRASRNNKNYDPKCGDFRTGKNRELLDRSSFSGMTCLVTTVQL